MGIQEAGVKVKYLFVAKFDSADVADIVLG